MLTKMTGMTNRTKPYLPTGMNRTIFGWGRHMKSQAPITLKPVPVPPPMRGSEESNWSKHLHTHNYRAKAALQVSPSKPPPGWPKGIRTNPNT